MHGGNAYFSERHVSFPKVDEHERGVGFDSIFGLPWVEKVDFVPAAQFHAFAFAQTRQRVIDIGPVGTGVFEKDAHLGLRVVAIDCAMVRADPTVAHRDVTFATPANGKRVAFKVFDSVCEFKFFAICALPSQQSPSIGNDTRRSTHYVCSVAELGLFAVRLSGFQVHAHLRGRVQWHPEVGRIHDGNGYSRCSCAFRSLCMIEYLKSINPGHSNNQMWHAEPLKKSPTNQAVMGLCPVILYGKLASHSFACGGALRLNFEPFHHVCALLHIIILFNASLYFLISNVAWRNFTKTVNAALQSKCVCVAKRTHAYVAIGRGVLEIGILLIVHVPQVM